jgi:hypothetical protein
VGTKRFDGLFEHLMIVCKQRVLSKRGEGFLNIVTEINWMTAFWGDLAQWMALTEEQAVGGEVVKTLMGEGTGSVEVTVFPENLAAKCKGE